MTVNYAYGPVTISGPYTDNVTHWQPYNPTVENDDFSKLFEWYTHSINQQIYKPSPLVSALKEKRHKMEDSVVHDAMRKRREKQADERIAFLDNEFSSLEATNGTIVTWRVSFHDTPDKTYHYVALKGGNRWYVTGDSSNYSLDGLITKIVGLSMKGSVFFEDADDPL